MDIKVSYLNAGGAKTITGILKLMNTGKLSFAEVGFLVKNLYERINPNQLENFLEKNETEICIEKIIENKYLKLDRETLNKNCKNKLSMEIENLEIDILKKIVLEIINEFYLKKQNKKNLEQYKINEDRIVKHLPSFIYLNQKMIMKELVEEGFLSKKIENDPVYGEMIFYQLKKIYI